MRWGTTRTARRLRRSSWSTKAGRGWALLAPVRCARTQRLDQGPGKRRLTVQITPWDRTTLYNTVNRRAVVFGEQFSLPHGASQGMSVFRLTEIVTLAPDQGLDERAANLQRRRRLHGGQARKARRGARMSVAELLKATGPVRIIYGDDRFAPTTAGRWRAVFEQELRDEH